VRGLVAVEGVETDIIDFGALKRLHFFLLDGS
jgi:hypothetical protein